MLRGDRRAGKNSESRALSRSCFDSPDETPRALCPCLVWQLFPKYVEP